MKRQKKTLFYFGKGKKVKKFFIVLKGSVSVLLPQPIQIDMSEDEYLTYLSKLRKFNEIDLLTRSIVQNKNIFELDDNQLEILYKTGEINKTSIQRKSSC